MSCCSTHCEYFMICARVHEGGAAVNWHDYGSGGSDIPTVSYCGLNGNYGMFQSAEANIIEKADLSGLFKRE